MKTLISCVCNMDNCCVKLKFTDDNMISIDPIAVENEVAVHLYQRSELDDLIHNVPLEYAGHICDGDPETYLKTVTEYKPLDEQCPAHSGCNILSGWAGFFRMFRMW